MIKYSWLVALIVSTFLLMKTYGQVWSIDDASQGWGMFVLGLASGYCAHELGHYVVATSKGYKVGNDGLSIVYPGAAFTDADHLQVSSARFQTQWLMAELALRDRNGNEMKEPQTNFGAGVVCAHLGITLAYLTVLKNHPQGDVAGMADATKRSKDNIILALAVPGALDTWRLFGNNVPEWVPQFSIISKGLGIAWGWIY